MSNPADRTGTAAAESVSGLTNFRLMKSDPVWAALAGELAKLQTLVLDLKAKLNLQVTAYNALATKYNALATKHNALATKLNSDAGVTDTDYATNAATDADTAVAPSAAADPAL